MKAQTLRWSMFALCVCNVMFLLGWGLWSLITDPEIGVQFFPVTILVSIPACAMGAFWWARATGRI